jgi:plastocyanin
MLVLTVAAGSTVLIAAPASSIKTNQVFNVDNARDKWKPGGHIYVSRGKDGKAKVVWKNPSSAKDHDVKSVNTGKRWYLKRKMLKPNNGNKAEKVFKKNGDYYFICTIHSAKVGGEWTGMVQRVHVRK